jgi:O-acetyl-ADP-ribose deacetylase
VVERRLVSTVRRLFDGCELVLAQGDITREQVDAIVNAANSSLAGGGGVDGAIHRAGGPTIGEECRQIRKITPTCPPGHAVITGAGNLAARHVIHAVGPIWHGGSGGEAETLARAYGSCLELAAASGDRTIAFPSISTGAYGYPVKEAARVALSTVVGFLQAQPVFAAVRFVLFDKETFAAYEQALEALP